MADPTPSATVTPLYARWTSTGAFLLAAVGAGIGLGSIWRFPYVTGANGGACVVQSIHGALDNNCSVLAVSSGIADFNYQDFIYPYKGYYNDIKANCADCTFREVPTFNDAVRAIGQSGGAAPAGSGGTR